MPTLTAVNTNSGAAAYISNTDAGSGLNITSGLTSAGSLVVQTTKALTVNDLAASSAKLTAGSGTLTVNPSQSITTSAGGITLQSGTSVQFDTNSTVTATGGNLSVSITSAPVNACQDNGANQGPSCRPTNALVYVQAGSALYWPTSPTDINAPSSFNVNSQNNRTLAINSNAAGTIVIAGGTGLKAN